MADACLLDMSLYIPAIYTTFHGKSNLKKKELELQLFSQKLTFSVTDKCELTANTE